MLWVECKSYLDSQGVDHRSFHLKPDQKKDPYRIFNDQLYREVVCQRLFKQLDEQGLIRLDRPLELTLCLAAGRIKNGSDIQLKGIFEANKWKLYAPDEMREDIKRLTDQGYEDDIAIFAVKMLRGTRNSEDVDSL